MLAKAITERPIFAFGAALGACALYFVVLSGVLSMFKVSPTLMLYVLLLALPVVLCGLFHHAVTRGAVMSKARRWLQIFASAFGAPILAWYLVVFGFVIVTGEGF